ncbi:ABC transporter permease [Actinoplanes auranticolor]|uniref:ABC transporter permease n=1 Tax=Actinoplanes auranticolor TaxID=47988 RepID=A0A919S5H2_9ACTN|nr:ABC transporter permease [Actinoplanes auranticolor]GIM65029.1 ABC transporter permease [Actinoplanes auranticolor]
MSTATLSPVAPSVAPAAPSSLRVTQGRVIRSEWIKFWSLRSTTITLATAVALLIGIGLLASSMLNSGAATGPEAGELGPVDASLAGITFAQLAFGTLGVLFMASEYSTGMIRSSLTAVPHRLPVLWGKITVFATVVFVIGLAASAIAFTGGQALIGDGAASWSDAGVARAVIGSAVILSASGILGLALGALLRSTPAAISTLFGAMFLLSGVAQLLLPESWRDNVVQYLPSDAGSAFTSVSQGADALSPWVGLGVFAVYVAAVVAGGAWRLKRSDA